MLKIKGKICLYSAHEKVKKIIKWSFFLKNCGSLEGPAKYSTQKEKLGYIFFPRIIYISIIAVINPLCVLEECEIGNLNFLRQA